MGEHQQESWGSCWVGRRTAGRRTHRPALSSNADAHTLAPSIFLCYSSCGPQHGKREAPCNIPSLSDVAHSVRARRKPAATQSDSKINTNSLLLKRSYCAGHPGGTFLWEPTRVRSKVTLECYAVSLSPVPVTIPEGVPYPLPAKSEAKRS